MGFWQGSKPELATALAAAIGIPFYLGFVHAPIPQLALYSGFAGAAMATGEFVETPLMKRGGIRLFMADTAIWAVVIGLIGGLTYLFALIF
jgi:hypothetical protein